MGWMVFKVLLGWTVLSALVAVLAGKVIKGHLAPPDPPVREGRLAPVGRRDYRDRPEPWVVSRDHPDQPDLPENLEQWVSQGRPDPQGQ
jgi:hypothetical protein